MYRPRRYHFFVSFIFVSFVFCISRLLLLLFLLFLELKIAIFYSFIFPFFSPVSLFIVLTWSEFKCLWNRISVWIYVKSSIRSKVTSHVFELIGWLAWSKFVRFGLSQLESNDWWIPPKQKISCTKAIDLFLLKIKSFSNKKIFFFNKKIFFQIKI